MAGMMGEDFPVDFLPPMSFTAEYDDAAVEESDLHSKLALRVHASMHFEKDNTHSSAAGIGSPMGSGTNPTEIMPGCTVQDEMERMSMITSASMNGGG